MHRHRRVFQYHIEMTLSIRVDVKDNKWFSITILKDVSLN